MLVDRPATVSLNLIALIVSRVLRVRVVDDIHSVGVCGRYLTVPIR